jgi:pathogenesis-related protein 1
MVRWGSLVMIMSCVALAACSGDDGGSAGDDTAGDDSSGDDDPGTPGEPAELAGIVDAHNDVRAMIDTTPALADLTWDDGLAATAVAWVDMCRDTEAPSGLIDHNPNRGNNVGENVFGATAGASGTGAVATWAGEKANYNYANNTCSGVCGHYTQIVWRSTTKVGCAIGNCPGLQFGSIVVCNYSPAGNVSNQKPY